MAKTEKFGYYFMYGAPVIDTKIDRRISSLRPQGQAVLHGWRMAFGGPDGLPTLVEDAQASVAGLTWLIGTPELPLLDREEVGYSARDLTMMVDGQLMPVRVYVAPATAKQPKPELVEKLKLAYQVALLPQAQIEQALSPAAA